MWKEEMYEAIAEYLRFIYTGLDINKVIDFEDRTEYGGGCSTCAYEETVCDITYLDSKGKVKTHTLTGTFSDLISNIT